MIKFNPDLAHFTVFTGKIDDSHKESRISYLNPAGIEMFGPELMEKRIVDIFGEILSSQTSGEITLEILLQEGNIAIEGTLMGKYVKLLASAVPSTRHFQASILDASESRKFEEGFEYTAKALARAAEANDEDTGNHVLRISKYSGKLAELMGLETLFIKNMGVLASLHDVGKVHVDPRILKKAGDLTKEEFEAIKSHTIYGAKIIGSHEKLSLAKEIAISHHERWDGSGYPYGYAGKKIPLSGRIVAIVDAFDALASERCYKPAFSYEKTFEILSKGDVKLKPEKHFDPDILKVFIDNYSTFTKIHDTLKKSLNEDEKIL